MPDEKKKLPVTWDRDEWLWIQAMKKQLRVKTPTAVIRAAVLELRDRFQAEGKLPARVQDLPPVEE
jgi:hypothetical protein